MSFSLKAELVFVRLRRLSSVTKNTDSCYDVTILKLSIHCSQLGSLALSGPSPTAIQARLTNANRRQRHAGSGSAIKPFNGSALDGLRHITAFTSTGWIGEDGRCKIKELSMPR